MAEDALQTILFYAIYCITLPEHNGEERQIPLASTIHTYLSKCRES